MSSLVICNIYGSVNQFLWPTISTLHVSVPRKCESMSPSVLFSTQTMAFFIQNDTKGTFVSQLRYAHEGTLKIGLSRTQPKVGHSQPRAKRAHPVNSFICYSRDRPIQATKPQLCFTASTAQSRESSLVFCFLYANGACILYE